MRLSEDAWNELEWTALHHDEATPEQRARLDAFLAAQDSPETVLRDVYDLAMAQPVSDWVLEERELEGAENRAKLRFRRRIRSHRLKGRLSFERFEREWDRYCLERVSALN